MLRYIAINPLAAVVAYLWSLVRGLKAPPGLDDQPRSGSPWRRWVWRHPRPRLTIDVLGLGRADCCPFRRLLRIRIQGARASPSYPPPGGPNPRSEASWFLVPASWKPPASYCSVSCIPCNPSLIPILPSWPPLARTVPSAIFCALDPFDLSRMPYTFQGLG
jgi:hypothetical protein